MTKRFFNAALAALLLCVLSACASVPADPLSEGVSALERRDYANALQILRPLADQGVASAQSMLGVMYANGEGVPKDFMQAKKWFQRAADQGHTNAQTNLGYMYFKGDGLIQDYVQTYKWLSLSAVGESNDKVRARRKELIRHLAAKMTPAEIAEAKKLVSEWRPLAPGASVPSEAHPMAPWKTAASSLVQRDIFQLILTLDVGTCNRRKIVNIEVIISPASGNSFTAIERWTLDRCGTQIPYRVTMSPSPRGGTDFNVSKESR